MEFIQEDISITANRGVEIKFFDDNKIIITASLETNKNLHSIVFGGCQAAVAILTGWALSH